MPLTAFIESWVHDCGRGIDEGYRSAANHQLRGEWVDSQTGELLNSSKTAADFESSL